MKKIKFVARKDGQKGIVAYIKGRPFKIGDVAETEDHVASELILRKKAELFVDKKDK